MKKMKNKNWLAWDYLAKLLDDFLDFYCDDRKCPITVDEAYDFVQFIVSKEYEE